MDLNGKVAVITGGGFGVGKAAGALMAENGVKLVLVDMNKEVLDTTVGEMKDKGYEVIGIQADVADLDAMGRVADEAFGTYGKVNIGMFNAGLGGGGSFLDKDMSGWRRIIGVNIEGTLHGIITFLPRMLETNEEGYILGTTSGAGVEGTMYQSPGYAATKMAILSLMECLWGQLRDMGSKLTAGCVFPTLTRSNMGSEPVEAMLRQAGVPAVLAEPEELANVIVEGMKEGRFFLRPNYDDDKKYFGGKLAPSLEWQDQMIRNKADAIISGTSPESYIWGAGGGRR